MEIEKITSGRNIPLPPAMRRCVEFAREKTDVSRAVVLTAEAAKFAIPAYRAATAFEFGELPLEEAIDKTRGLLRTAREKARAAAMALPGEAYNFFSSDEEDRAFVVAATALGEVAECLADARRAWEKMNAVNRALERGEMTVTGEP